MYFDDGSNKIWCWLCWDECCEKKKEAKVDSKVREMMEFLFIKMGLMGRGAGLEEDRDSSLFGV